MPTVYNETDWSVNYHDRPERPASDSSLRPRALRRRSTMNAVSLPPRQSIQQPRNAGRLWTGGLIALLLAVVGVGCGKKPPAKEDKPVEVEVTTPITDDVLDYDDFTGRLDAFRTVDI